MLIGLTGFKQVGKSTAASYLEEAYGFTRHNFKDALVQEMKENFPDLLREIDAAQNDFDGIDKLFELKPPAMRALMQNYGTQVRRGDREDYWTEQWRLKYGKLYPESVVVDDVRFLNEAETIKDFGGTIIQLTRPDIQDGGTHQSETEQLKITPNYIVTCVPSDHAHLYRALDDIIKEL